MFTSKQKKSSLAGKCVLATITELFMCHNQRRSKGQPAQDQFTKIRSFELIQTQSTEVLFTESNPGKYNSLHRIQV